VLAVLASCVASSALAQDPDPASRGDLTNLALEDLLKVQVTSAAKRSRPLSQTAAAVYVITREDIERSGAASILEALRLAPGLQVARIGSSTWAITARGFNGRFANKLLVMIDGRSVYTPQFAGVYWDVQDTFLEDVERIEVIRGPGASLWGTNAVNGVINILTRQAAETRGGLAVAGGGSEERGFAGLRYGHALGGRGSYRAYAKYFDRDTSLRVTGEEAHDAWDAARGGFRADWSPGASDALVVQGDLYGNDEDGTTTEPVLGPPYAQSFETVSNVSGGNLLGRWTHRLPGGSEAELQTYFDRTRRVSDLGLERHMTYDLDFQHRFGAGARQEIVWGLGYRATVDGNRNTFTTEFDPPRRQVALSSAFIQDDVRLSPAGLRLTLGSKFEHNSYTGFEYQPTIRLLWPARTDQTLWAAISRAVRTPSRAENDVRFNQSAFDAGGGTTGLVAFFGNPDIRSEELLAYEVGYRVQATESLSLDVASFYNTYTDLLSLTQGTPFPESSPPPPHLVVPVTAGNGLEGESYGIEIASAWRPAGRWKLSAWYSRFVLRLHPDITSIYSRGDDPTNQFQIRSNLDLPRNFSLDTIAQFVEDLPNQDVPDYIRFDLRIAWRPTSRLEASLVGQNLLQRRHGEFGSSSLLTTATEVERAVYGKVTWRF
jgi:iron complex outermembrane receptor protein